MPSYKLTYFAIKGLGEPIRYLLSYMGEDFQDVRFPFSDWTPEKKKGFPFGKVPQLEVDGEVLHDSVAICRYLATSAGLAGANPKENLHIDMAYGAVGDFIDAFRRCVREPNEELKETLKKVCREETVPFYMERLEKMMKENGGYLANGKLSWADLYFIAWSESLQTVLGIDLSKQYPGYASLKQRVQSLPGIKEYIAKRPETPF